MTGKRSGLAPAIVGSIMSLGAFAISFVITGASSRAVSDAIEQQTGPIAKTNTSTKPALGGLGQTVQPPTNPSPDAKLAVEAEGDGWVGVPATATLGDVEVRVITARVGSVELVGPTGVGISEGNALALTIEIINRSPNRKIDYRTWAGSGFSIGRDFASLSDNFGNTYKRIDFCMLNQSKGRVTSESIYPGKGITDVLVFEPPIDTIETLDLEMPAKNLGIDGRFRFQIRANFIEH